MQQVTTTSDVLGKKVIINRISDVPGGISLLIANLVAGKHVQEGTPLTAPSSGARTVCKEAVLLTGSVAAALKVSSQLNNFKVGEFIGQKLDGIAGTITEITTSDGVDTIAIDSDLEAFAAGTAIYEMAALATDDSALKNTPDVILKEAYEVPSTSQVIVIKDALVRADVQENCIGALNLAQLPGVIVIKY